MRNSRMVSVAIAMVLSCAGTAFAQDARFELDSLVEK